MFNEVIFVKMPRTIEINEKGMYSALSNLSVAPFKTSDGLVFKSAVRAYYYFLLKDEPKLQKAVYRAKNLSEIIKVIGHERYVNLCRPFKHSLYYDINHTKDIIFSVLLNKLLSNSRCVDILLSTWGCDLIVDNGMDSVLGVGKARNGLNLTGQILMELRSMFQKIRADKYNEANRRTYCSKNI